MCHRLPLMTHDLELTVYTLLRTPSNQGGYMEAVNNTLFGVCSMYRSIAQWQPMVVIFYRLSGYQIYVKVLKKFQAWQ